jgi:hypothetical protein
VSPHAHICRKYIQIQHGYELHDTYRQYTVMNCYYSVLHTCRHNLNTVMSGCVQFGYEPHASVNDARGWTSGVDGDSDHLFRVQVYDSIPPRMGPHWGGSEAPVRTPQGPGQVRVCSGRRESTTTRMRPVETRAARLGAHAEPCPGRAPGHAGAPTEQAAEERPTRSRSRAGLARRRAGDRPEGFRRYSRRH